MSLRVLDPGLYTLVVDFGRPATRSLGVAVGGAADRISLALGNALVGNPPDAAALEITLTGPTLRAEAELGCVVYGAPFELSSNRQSLAVGKTFTLTPGEELHVGGTPERVRAYLCVRSGLQTPWVLGSRSGLEPVRAGDLLPCLPGRIHHRFAEIKLELDWRKSWEAGWYEHASISLYVLVGPQASLFPDDILQRRPPPPRTWVKEGPSEPARPEGGGPSKPRVFRVAPASNRMGLRLQGEPLPVPDAEIVSEPVCPGAVQVTRDGQCIVLGVDCQTIGGYPKIAQVISADLDRLGQLRPGEEVYFWPVSLEEAETIYRRKQAELHEWLTRLQTAEVFP